MKVELPLHHVSQAPKNSKRFCNVQIAYVNYCGVNFNAVESEGLKTKDKL